jgi:hypothetical protein
VLLPTGLAAADAEPAREASHQERVERRDDRFDRRLSRIECEVMGRVFDRAHGCSRTRCRGSAVLAKSAVNAEVCRLRGNTAFAYGAAIDYRRCRALHRRWVAPVNWCAANPARARQVVRGAPACLAPHTSYVTLRETEGYYDECLTPSRVRELRRIARSTGVSLARAASLHSRTLCGFRPGHVFRDGRCVAARGPTGPQGGVLLVGDSIAYRGINELAPLAAEMVLDGHPGRSLSQLAGRLEWFRSGRGEPSGLIVALGANAGRGVTRSELEQAVDSLPPTTRLLLVLPFRMSPRTDRVVAYTRRYGAWMRRIARTRDGTCLADWPALVERRPHVLVDGVHPTPAGEAYWARWVRGEWDRCSDGSR